MTQIAIDDIRITEYQRETMPWTVQEIYESIQDHGYNEAYPVVLDDENNLVDGGHRIKAAKQAGVTAIPFVHKPDGIPSVRYALLCNDDRGKGREDDVFDLAELCWRMGKTLSDNESVAKVLGWSPSASSNYRKIKERLHTDAWELARFTKKNGLVNLGQKNGVNPEFTEVNWNERYFRALLKHLPINGQQDNATMRGQLAIIQQCLYRWQKKPKDNKGKELKVTASWIEKEAQRLAWHIQLKQVATELLKPWVSLRRRIALFENINEGNFGDLPNDENLAQFHNAIEALNGKEPRLYIGSAEDMSQLENESVDIIITSAPYNLRRDHWKMGGQGRQPRIEGIGYDQHRDDLPEPKYQDWQIACLIEMYRVAKPGASLFYNHKARNKKGEAIFPHQWLLQADNPWTVRQEIWWDRTSTHNHNPDYFWPEDERIFWMVKGDKPALHNDSIGVSTIWRFHGPKPDTWHPAPFPDELPRQCLKAIGGRNLIVLDPFAGSCTTLRVALSEFGFDAIGYDISEDYLNKAKEENGWIGDQKAE